MSAEHRVAVRWGSQRYVVARAANLQTEERATLVARFVAVDDINRWSRDESLLPELLRCYEAVTGETLRASTRSDIEQLVHPRLCRAFERGELVLLQPNFAERAAPSGEGVHGAKAPPAPAPPPPRAKPARISVTPVPPGPDIPPESIDQDLQAQTLVDAAALGVPFCEECEKARRERDASAGA